MRKDIIKKTLMSFAFENTPRISFYREYEKGLLDASLSGLLNRPQPTTYKHYIIATHLSQLGTSGTEGGCWRENHDGTHVASTASTAEKW